MGFTAGTMEHSPDVCTGSAARRLRCFSEGGEEEAVVLAHGPLPDLVPVAQAYRERSHSSPDVETLRRQRETARAVGRELRRLSDEFVRCHEALRGPPNRALAVVQAEVNGVVVFVLRGVRWLLHTDLGAYLRQMVLRPRRHPPDSLHPPDSPVDLER